MKNNKYKYSFSITIAICLILLFLFNQNLHFPNGSILDNTSNNTSNKKKIVHPQYDSISSLQTAFIRNAKLVGPSVVNLSKIQLKAILNNSNKSLFRTLIEWFDDYFARKEYISETIGSGVIINGKGHILTNYHVIDGHKKILVRLSDQRSYFADVIGSDPDTDIAVIKINSFRRLPQPIFGSSAQIKVGEWVMAIGNPYGLQGSVTVGVVSGIRRSDLGIASYENFLQTDASISPGNSGGPLINLNGEIIAINTSSAALGSGVGFAIPIEMALRISEELINYGSVQRGWLGIDIQDMTPELFSAFKISGIKKGVLVNNVKNNTPAKKAGIMRGDIVLKYNGKNVSNIKKFQSMVASTRAGKQVRIDVIRNSLKKSFLVTIGELTF
jgi:serine protease Do